MITLMNVNDAYSVSVTPNVCAIKAGFDGTHPILDNAYCDITVVRGDAKVPFVIKSTTSSHNGIKYDINGSDETKRLVLTDIPIDALSGSVSIEVSTEDEFVATAIFQYSIMREATMLDWIKDWESNKTTIGSTYLITPKLFVGRKVNTEADLSVLTGVYIGPDSNNGAGIYGYKQGEDIFHINDSGGHIGGWNIENKGIQTQDGTLKILSEGSIISIDKNGNSIWELNKSGEATFACGKVKFYTNGDAEFEGQVKSSKGKIGGWHIDSGVLYSSMTCLDADNNYIGISAQGLSNEGNWDANSHKAQVTQCGGVYMYYDNAVSYGILGYLPQTNINGEDVQRITFSLGANNLIAGWKFDDTAIWIGEKKLNTLQQYTSDVGCITLGTNGLRGYKWYIDSNGDISFMGGKIQFTSTNDGGEIVGWKLNQGRFSTNNVALVSDDSITGLYMSANADANFNSLASISLEEYINSNGGIYIKVKSTSANFAAYNLNGKKLFEINSSGRNYIANWIFDYGAIYIGDKATTADFSPNNNSITISTLGLLGYKWKLLQDGSGAIAGGNISWDNVGNITFTESVKIGWSNLGDTVINSEGVFAGKISADNITAGTISTANIKNGSDTWSLNQNGSGKLANGAIQWDADGLLEVKNSNLNNVVISGGIKTPFTDGYTTIGGTNKPTLVSRSGIQNNNCIVIPGTTKDITTEFAVPFTSDYNGFRAVILNYDWEEKESVGSITASAPYGLYFYEDGNPMSVLTINPCEMVEMIGIGEGDTFKGWLVLKRCLYLYNNGTRVGEGFDVRAMYLGKVQFVSGTPTLIRQKRWNRNMRFETNEKLNISYSEKKVVTVHFPTGIFSSSDEYEVLLTGQNDAGTNIFACVANKTADSFTVYTGDDESFNAGGFTFMVIGTWFWD